MFAIRQYDFGPAENLLHEEVEDPHPGPGQVRIAVRAAGVHLIDTAIRAGASGGPMQLPELPMIPGREVAGVVEQVGPGVDPGWRGARVVAHLGAASGGYAELAVREVGAAHALPDGMGFDTAVAMVGTGRTTTGILDAAQLTRDDVLLVTAAAGGIGSLLVQVGRNLGATVVAVAGGPAKVAQARALGATVAVDYRQDDWPEQVREALGGREVTVVLEGVGGTLGRAALELLGTGGRLLMFGWASAAGTPTQVTTADLAARGLTATWAIGPAMLRRRGLRDLEEQALAALESRATTGKVVLVP